MSRKRIVQNVRARACRQRCSASPILFMLIAAHSLAWTTGCVRRTLTIHTEPQGGLVYLNDEEVGYSPVSVDFTWYGDYDVIVRKEGYETLKTHHTVQAPWYQLPVVDFVAEALWPGHIHDVREASFTLTAASAPDRDALIERAESTRADALGEQPTTTE